MLLFVLSVCGSRGCTYPLSDALFADSPLTAVGVFEILRLELFRTFLSKQNCAGPSMTGVTYLSRLPGVPVLACARPLLQEKSLVETWS